MIFCITINSRRSYFNNIIGYCSKVYYSLISVHSEFNILCQLQTFVSVTSELTDSVVVINQCAFFIIYRIDFSKPETAFCCPSIGVILMGIEAC